jgi:hypothetical protein
VLAPMELELNFKTLLVVNKRVFEVTLLLIEYPYIIKGTGYVVGVLAAHLREGSSAS